MKDYIAVFEKNKDRMIEDLQALIRCPSMEGPPTAHQPFGPGVDQAFETMLKIGQRDGFDTKNVDHYGGHIQWKGQGKGLMGIVAHLDVVPPGTGWSQDPYGGQIQGDRIFGRGAIDNKGPLIAAYYAMVALKEAGYRPQKDIRLILGLDEETNWKGMAYYLEKEKMPDFGFSPDADFPVIHGEKGILIFDMVKKIPDQGDRGLVLRFLEGGHAANMVPDQAHAWVNEDPTQALSAYLGKYRNALSVSREKDSWKISAKGISAHGAQPEKGLNAISILFDFLGTLTFDSGEINDWIKGYNQTIGFDLDGRRLGCGLEDEPSGKLILNVGKSRISSGQARHTVNIRYPVTLNEEQVYQGIKKVLLGQDIELEPGHHLKPLYVPREDPLVETLMAVYGQFTQDRQSEPLVIGGGTYARCMKNTVAYGAVFPGDPQVEHQPDEYVSVSRLVKAGKIFTEAIYRLTKEE